MRPEKDADGKIPATHQRLSGGILVLFAMALTVLPTDQTAAHESGARVVTKTYLQPFHIWPAYTVPSRAGVVRSHWFFELQRGERFLDVSAVRDYVSDKGACVTIYQEADEHRGDVFYRFCGDRSPTLIELMPNDPYYNSVEVEVHACLCPTDPSGPYPATYGEIELRFLESRGGRPALSRRQ